jgi:hypothetical protein
MQQMGADKLLTPFDKKKDVYTNISNIVLATTAKVSLVKISSAEIKSKRTRAYRYLLP